MLLLLLLTLTFLSLATAALFLFAAALLSQFAVDGLLEFALQFLGLSTSAVDLTSEFASAAL